MSDQEEKLARFGDRVLDILQEDENWSTDTLGAISDVAFNLGLAEEDSEFFKRKDAEE